MQPVMMVRFRFALRVLLKDLIDKIHCFMELQTVTLYDSSSSLSVHTNE